MHRDIFATDLSPGGKVAFLRHGSPSRKARRFTAAHPTTLEVVQQRYGTLQTTQFSDPRSIDSGALHDPCNRRLATAGTAATLKQGARAPAGCSTAEARQSDFAICAVSELRLTMRQLSRWLVAAIAVSRYLAMLVLCFALLSEKTNEIVETT